MKKLIAALFFTISVSATAKSVFLMPTCSTWNGECQITNSSGEDISCNIRVNARTKAGKSLNNSEYKTLYKGMYGWVRVINNNNRDPITSINGNASCNTLN